MARYQRQYGVAAAFLMVATLASTIVSAPAPAEAADQDLPLIFPVVGEVRYSDTWGACRGTGCSRRHEGNDLMAAKMTPVVAVADGYIKMVNWSSNPNDMNPDRCCTIALKHDDGWESWYIHLNNDTPSTDSGTEWGIAEGIVPGVRVVAGQLIGWVGDSGNAEGTASHLHYEYHQPDGTPINPNPYLNAATRITQPLVPTWGVDFDGFDPLTHPGGTLTIDTDKFIDWTITVSNGNGTPVWVRNGDGPGQPWWNGATDPGVHDVEVDFGVYGTMSSTVRVGNYSGRFVDDEGSYAEADIERMWSLGITMGCSWNSYCPDDTLTRAQAATLIARAVGDESDYPSYQGYFSDVPSGTWYTGPLEFLVEEGALEPGGAFMATDPGARAFVVAVLVDALGHNDYPSYQGYFSDIGPDHPLRGPLELAYELDIARGYPDGEFKPDRTLTREEAAAFLMRTFGD